MANQTRPDIGFDIAKIAADPATSRTDVAMALATVMLYNRTVRFHKVYGRIILYSSRGASADTFGGRWRRFQMAGLIFPTDAGFGPLTGSRPIE